MHVQTATKAIYPRTSQNSATLEPLDLLLSTSDYMVSCLPLNSETVGLMDAQAVSRMKAGAYLVNVGRGSVIREDAIAEALKSGQLGGYAADVFEMEDWALPGRPTEISADLLGLTHRTLFTPHIGSTVDDIRLKIAMVVARNIVQLARGEKPEGAINHM